jgi:hypothetical protein
MSPNHNAMLRGILQLYQHLSGQLRFKCLPRAALLAIAALLATSKISWADEGGVPFWLSGQFGSLAAAPQVPGWSIGIINYYASVSASGNVGAARLVTINNLPRNVNVNLNVNLSGKTDLVFASPSYTFATPVFGGQLGVSLGIGGGPSTADLGGTLTAMAGPIIVTSQGQISETRGGVSDLYPGVSLRWNSGVNSWMVYGMGDIPTGTYNSSQLVNFGIGHGALDGGVGYTYFDEKTGHELSVVTGLTYNLVNPSTNYQNGIDWHFDWGASQFLTKQFQVGLVGYFYRQLTADRGCVQTLCPFQSQIIGVGPQIGYLFPVGNMQGYLNLKGYGEFDAQSRAAGYNVWLTFALSPAPSATEKAPPPMLTKSPPRN